MPFRVLRTFEGIIPFDRQAGMLDAVASLRAAGKTGLGEWMAQAETMWAKHSANETTLIGRWNYHNELGAQFPIAPIRVVYAKAGTLPAAAIVEDRRVVIDHMLYWAAITTLEEGLYLASILGSEAARSRVENLQSRGQWGARHFDKVMFTLPIPRFDLSFPKIISARSNDAALTKSAQREWLPVAGPRDRTAHPCSTTDASASDCNNRYMRPGSAGDAARRR